MNLIFLTPEVWERTPLEAPDYTRTLESYVVALEAAVLRLEAMV